jgi:hypothetical protein
MKYMRITAGYTWTDHKTNTGIAKKLNIAPVLDKIREKLDTTCNQNVLATDCRMKNCTQKGRSNQGRQFKRLLDEWDRNGSTTGPTT